MNPMNLFKLFGNLGNLAKIQEDIKSITEEISSNHYHGNAGAGMVMVKVSGAQQIVSCTIDPKLIAENDREMIEDLIVAAANQALLEAKRQSAELMQRKLGEKLDMPELGSLINNFMPKG